MSDRPHPGFEPIGYRAGPIFFYPKLMTGLRYDSNIYAVPNTPRSDWALVMSPELTVRYADLAATGQPSASSFSYDLNLRADIYRFREVKTEDRTDAQARLTTRWEIAQGLQLRTSFQAARKHQDRGDSTALSNAAEPVPFNDLRAEGTLTQTRGRFELAVNAGVRNLQYEDVRAFDGSVLDLGGRNGTIVSAFVKPSYEFSPGYRAFLRLAGNQREYAGTGVQERDSRGYDLRGGLEFFLTPLIFGAVELGYLSQSYENAAIPPVDGVSFKGQATWLATTLVTMTFMAERRIAETVAPGFDARLDTSYGVKLDYELLRNVIAAAEINLTHEDFRGTLRQDDVVRLTAGIDYLMNRHLRTGIRYDFIQRDSTVSFYSFDKHVVTFNAAIQF